MESKKNTRKKDRRVEMSVEGLKEDFAWHLRYTLAKAEGWYRWQLVLRAPTAPAIAAAVKWIRSARPAPEGLRVSFDIDAVNLM